MGETNGTDLVFCPGLSLTTIFSGQMIKDRKKPFFISICSGKGGVGKSVIAANLAYVMSKRNSVLVWDADMDFPNQHLLTGVEPPLRLTDVYTGKCAAAAAVFTINDNFHLLADKPGAGASYDYEPEAINKVFEELKDNTDYDLVIIDTAAGASFETLQCCNISDLVLFIVTDEPTSLLDAYGLIKIFLPYADFGKIMLLVNNVIDLEDAEEVKNKLNKATKNFLCMELEFAGFIPYGRVVRKSIMRQELFAETDPAAEVSKSILSLVERIAPQALENKHFEK